MKKLHKIGTGILLGVTPVVAAVTTIAVSIATKEEQIVVPPVPEATWLDKYQELETKFNAANDTFFYSDEITYRNNHDASWRHPVDVSCNVVDNSRDAKFYSADKLGGVRGDSDHPISMPTYDKIRAMIAQTESEGWKDEIEYGLNDEYFRIVCPYNTAGKGETPVKWKQEYIVNKYGYIVKRQTTNEEGVVVTFEDNKYSCEPHSIDKYTISKYATYGTESGEDPLAYNVPVELSKDKTYTITLNVQRYPINSFYVYCSGEKVALSNVTIDNAPSDWRYVEADKAVKGSTTAKNTTITITFTLEEDNLWDAYLICGEPV